MDGIPFQVFTGIYFSGMEKPTANGLSVMFSEY